MGCQMRKILALFLLIFGYFVSACGELSSPSTVRVPSNGLITVGVIAGNTADDATSIQPLADALANSLHNYGIQGGRVHVANSVEEMAAWLKSGTVDLYIDSAYPAVLACQQSGAKMLLRGWEFGQPDAHVVIFTNRNTGLRTLSDLRGKMIALRQPQATSSFFLSAAHLLRHELSLSSKSNFSATVSPSEVGFIVSESDQNTLRAVLTNAVAAGAVDDYSFDIVFSPETLQQLVELDRTEKIPRQVVVARPGLDKEYLEILTETLTNMNETEDGKAALAAFQTTRFDHFPDGAEATERKLREMLATIKQIALP
ncbi:MAG: hypothetical protein DDG60_12995 [Anaerolineae bacterium]|nr:MAG: hypothetical protein DDG60_12995 [Anaerolineae bacterium]